MQAKASTQSHSNTASATELHNATKAGDIKKVRSLLNQGADINMAEGKYYYTPLHTASKEGHAEIVTLLIERGANVNAKRIFGHTPLHEAAFEGKTNIAKLLIDRGADVNAKSNSGNTPLHETAFEGHKETTRLLIERGADVNAKDNNGITPLYWARSENKHETAEVIQEAMDRQRRSSYIQQAPINEHDIIWDKPKVTSSVDKPPTTRMPVNPNAYAVVIGIEKYRERLPDAPYAKSDAETMAKYLTESMGF